MIYILIAILFFCAIYFALIQYSKRERNRLAVTQYDIVSKQIPKGFDGYKFAVLADYHNANEEAVTMDLISRINEEKPEHIILAGDMVVGSCKKESENLASADFVRELCKIAPVFYGFGNHENELMTRKNKMGNQWDRYMERLCQKNTESPKLLMNASVQIERNSDRIRIYGLNLNRFFFRRFYKKPLKREYLNQLLGEKTKDYSILIGHNPDYFKEYADWGANLVVSGHQHGGLMILPFLGGVISPRLHIFPKYDFGYFKRGDSQMIVSRGLGAHSPKIRVNNLPELIFITLHTEM